MVRQNREHQMSAGRWGPRLTALGLVGLALAASLTVTAGRSAASDSENGLIAFSAGGDLATVNPDGTGATMLFDTADDSVFGPAWSPNGAQLASSMTQPGDSSSRTYRMTDTGTSIVPVADHGSDMCCQVSPAWSPGGDSIAFVGKVFAQDPFNDAYDLFVVNLKYANGPGDPAVNITNTPYGGSELAPTWAPDGWRIFYERSGHIWSVDLGVMYPADLGIVGGDPDVSPDGTRLAFTRPMGDSTYEIVTANVDGTDEQVVTDLNARTLAPAWAPDGQWIAFESTADAPDPGCDGSSCNYEIYKIRPDGTGLMRLTYNPQADRTPDWQPSTAGHVGTDTERASVDSAGTQADDMSYLSSISANGRYVVFESPSTNLVPEDGNPFNDVFMRDRLSGETTQVSVNPDGSPIWGNHDLPLVSDDGTEVLFVAHGVPAGLPAGGLVVRNLGTGAYDLVSLTPAGTPVPCGLTCARTAALSGDGRFALFTAHTDALPGGEIGTDHLYVRDRTLGTTEQVDVAPDGSTGDGPIDDTWRAVAVTPDGRFVAFLSRAANLVPGDTNGTYDAFVRDRVAGTTERVSVASDGTQSAGSTGSCIDISADGNRVVFRTHPGDIGGSPTPGGHLYMRDRTAGTTTPVGLDADSTPFRRPGGFGCAISRDGARVAFTAGTLSLSFEQIFVRDLATGQVDLVSAAFDTGDASDSTNQFAAFSADGLSVTWSANATDLVDDDTNDYWDIFVAEHDLAADTVNVTVSGAHTYTNTGELTTGNIEIGPDAVTGTGWLRDTGWTPTPARFTVNLRRFWITQLYVGTVQISDVDAGLSLSTPVLFASLGRPTPNEATGTATWFTYFPPFTLRPYRISWAVRDGT